MCGRNQAPIVLWALRAVAAGVGGKELAVWALEEAMLDEKERQEAEARSIEAMMNAAQRLSDD